MTCLPEGLKNYLRTPFVMIVWVMETYAKNRARLKVFMAEPRVAKTFKIAVVATTFVWLAIAFMANPEHGQRLTDAVKNFWTETQNLSEQRKALQESKEAAQ